MNDRQSKQLGVIQNLSWIDRFIRFIVGTILVSVPLTIIGMNLPLRFDGTSVSVWVYVTMLVAIYPFWTATIGWDPVYALFGFRTCGGSEKNPCGTLPYELDAAMGHHPIPESDYQHNLVAAHHAGEAGRQQEESAEHHEPRRVSSG